MKPQKVFTFLKVLIRTTNSDLGGIFPTTEAAIYLYNLANRPPLMRMGWEHDLMRDRKAQDIPFFESIEEIARLHRDQMDLWAQAKEHLSRKLGWIENFLKDIESALNEVLLDE